MLKNILFSFIIFLCFSCFSDKNKKINNLIFSNQYHFNYDLENPTNKIILANILNEISGISFYKENEILAVQDERGILFHINIEKHQIISEYKFAKNGDFEDIEIIKDTVFILKSNGNIFKLQNWQTDSIIVKEFKTSLNTKNDTEGLSYNEKENTLLIACKGSPYIAKKDKLLKEKAIYSFSLAKKLLNEKTFFSINTIKIKDFFLENETSKKWHKKDIFKPSAIAKNPLNNDYYLLSNTEKLLIVVDNDFEIKYIYKLNSKLFKQPEGICFSPDGKLFISNEGKKGKANILIFELLN